MHLNSLGLLGIALCIAVQTVSARTSRIPAFPDTAGTMVDSGEGYRVRVVATPGSPAKTAEAVFRVDRSPRACFGVITDYESYPSFMPNIRKTEITGRRGDTTDVAYSFRITPFTVHYSLRLVQSTRNDTLCCDWTYIKGSIKNTKGSWRILPDPSDTGASILHYRVLTEPGAMVPGWVTSALTTRSIPKMIANIRREAKKRD